MAGLSVPNEYSVQQANPIRAIDNIDVLFTSISIRGKVILFEEVV